MKYNIMKCNKYAKLMNNIGIILILFMAIGVFSTAVFAETGTAALKATLINHDPDPAGPGDYVDVKIRIENEGSKSAQDVKVEFLEGFPFTLDPGFNATKALGTIGGKQTDDLGVIVEYRVIISAQAIEGNNKAKVKFWETGKTARTYEFDIEIKTQDSGLAIDSVETKNLEPGSKGSLVINVENPSDSTLRDVEVKLDLSSDDLPFAPSDSATTKRIKFLSPNQIGKVTFNIVPFPDADTKVYKVPVGISYYDSTNEFVEKEDLVGITVSAKPDLSFTVDSSKLTQGIGKGAVTLNIINKGLIDVKFLNVIFKNTDHYEVISTNEEYIGNVDSDDFETTDLTIMKKTSSNEFPLVFDITYKDANNQEFSLSKEVPMKLYATQGGGFGFGTVLLIIIVLVVLYIGYKKIFKKKRKA